MNTWTQQRIDQLKQYFKNEGGRFTLLLLLGGSGAMLYVLLGELPGNAFPTLRFTDHNLVNVFIQFLFGIAAAFLGAFVLANASLKKGSEFRHSAGVALIHGMIWPFIIGQSMDWGKRADSKRSSEEMVSLEDAKLIDLDFRKAVDPEYFSNSVSLWRDQQIYPLHDRRNAIDSKGRLEELALKKFESAMVQRVLTESKKFENQVGLIRELSRGFETNVLAVKTLEECIVWLPIDSAPDTSANIIAIVFGALEGWENSEDSQRPVTEKIEIYGGLWSIFESHIKAHSNRPQKPESHNTSQFSSAIESLKKKVKFQLSRVSSENGEQKNELGSFLLSKRFPTEFTEVIKLRLNEIENMSALVGEIDDLILQTKDPGKLEVGELIVLTKDLKKKAEILEKRFPASEKLQAVKKILEDEKLKPERALEGSASVTIHYSAEESQKGFSEQITDKLNKSGNWVCHGFSQAPERAQNYVTHSIEVRYFDQTNKEQALALAQFISDMGAECGVVRGVEKPTEKQENGRFEIWMKKGFLPPKE